MSTRMPPRGRGPQNTARQPVPYKGEPKAAPVPSGRRLRLDFLLIIVIAAIVTVYAVVSGGAAPAGGPGASANAGANTPKPGKGTSGASASHVPVTDLPMITEVMSSNSGSIAAEDGKYYDWIELYNPTDRTINLQGFALTDNLKKPTKCILPSYSLGPRKYVIVFADGSKESKKDELHASFKLRATEQQTLMLVDPNGTQVQTVTCPPLKTNSSYALNAADSKTWNITDSATPGYPNTKEGAATFAETRRALSDVKINEVMPGNTLTKKDEDGEFSDWVELYNGSDKAVDLTGWGLSDDEAEPKRWEFPAMKIEPKQYLLVFVSGKNRAEAGKELHADFRLNAFNDRILLSNFSGQIVSEVVFKEMKPDTSYGETPGTGKWDVFTHPTPGQPNNEDGFNALQSELFAGEPGDIVISEVLGNNSPGEGALKDQDDEYPDWIELYNRTDHDISLKGWGLTDKSDEPGRWKFQDVTLKAGQYLTVFASGKGLDAKKKLHTDFNIGSGGDILVLTDPKGAIADRCFVPPLRNGISYARPKGSAVFMYMDNPTPGAVNPSGGYPGFTPDPVFSLPAGQYTAAQKVTVSTGDARASIYYTTDCTTPNSNDKKASGEIAMDKTTVIRAVAYRSGYLPSNEVASTFLIGEDIGLPVVSIVTDPDNLWDEETGIYANYSKDWIRRAHFEVLDNDGSVGVSQFVGIKISGAQSKKDNKQKSFGIYAKSIYGNGVIEGIDGYRIFQDLPYTDYENLMIRNSGQDARLTRIRDTLQIGLANETTRDTDLDMQAHRQSILFVNGEFFGVYDIMEKVNEHFLAQHHGLDPKKINLLLGNGKALSGVSDEYDDLMEYVKDHDLSVEENYKYVASKIDVDNYIDWCTVEIYTGNTDLGNIKFWKPQTPDSKWKWILFDMDWGFFYADQSADKRDEYYRDNFSRFLDPRGNGVGRRFSTLLIRKLLENEEFKKKFIKRFYYHATVTFETDRVLKRVDELQANIEPYMQRDKDFVKSRFGQSTGDLASWKRQLEIVRTYARIRPEMNLNYMKKYFHLSDDELQQIVNN